MEQAGSLQQRPFSHFRGRRRTTTQPVEVALEWILLAEGSSVTDHAADSGGLTRYGITERTLLEAQDVGLVSREASIRTLTHPQACEIYRAAYWSTVERLPPVVALVVFDHAVHGGPGRAIRLLQQVLRVEADGVIGPATLQAARAAALSLNPPTVLRSPRQTALY